MNLIGNAIKFTQQGEVALHVERAAERSDRVVLRFSVNDTGIGIPPEKQIAIFQPFEQADGSTTRRFGGTGLGLAISLRLVEMMKGEIGVESAPGRGSKFHFTVTFEVRDAGQPTGTGLFPNDRENLTALIVDDNPTCCRNLAESLAELGFTTTILGDARLVTDECERAAAIGRPYRIALIDSAMPYVDGFDLAAYLLARQADRPSVILLLSSSDRQQDLERRRQVGAHHLQKPVLPGDLVVALSRPYYCQPRSRRSDRVPRAQEPPRRVPFASCSPKTT